MLGDAPLGPPDLPKLEFTTQVIQEGLRLYPPFWMIDRMAIADDRVGDIDIPAGSTVIVMSMERTTRRATGRIQRPLIQDSCQGNEKLRDAPFTYLPFWRRPAGLHRQSLRDAPDPHDPERAAQKIRF